MGKKCSPRQSMCIIFPMIVMLAIVVSVGEAVGHTNQNHVLHNLDYHGVGQSHLQQCSCNSTIPLKVCSSKSKSGAFSLAHPLITFNTARCRQKQNGDMMHTIHK